MTKISKIITRKPLAVSFVALTLLVTMTLAYAPFASADNDRICDNETISAESFDNGKGYFHYVFPVLFRGVSYFFKQA